MQSIGPAFPQITLSAHIHNHKRCFAIFLIFHRKFVLHNHFCLNSRLQNVLFGWRVIRLENSLQIRMVEETLNGKFALKTNFNENYDRITHYFTLSINWNSCLLMKHSLTPSSSQSSFRADEYWGSNLVTCSAFKFLITFAFSWKFRIFQWNSLFKVTSQAYKISIVAVIDF